MEVLNGMKTGRNRSTVIKKDEWFLQGSIPCTSGRILEAIIITNNYIEMKVSDKMFDFRIIYCPDGTQIIDHSLKTPYSSLTHVQMEEYIEVDNQIAIIERIRRKEQRDEKKKKCKENLFYKLACICGIV